jgi:transcriptional regulator with XRE-family HTH domain
VNDEEMFVALGALSTEARKLKGRHKKEAAEEMGIADSTLRFFELGKNSRFPQQGTLYAMEEYYGWRRGVIRETWDNRRAIAPGTLTLDMMLPERPKGLLTAAHLSDQELMAELNFRFLMRDNREPFDG